MANVTELGEASQPRGLTAVKGAEKYGITGNYGDSHKPRL
jgi:hypothetical protein